MLHEFIRTPMAIKLYSHCHHIITQLLPEGPQGLSGVTLKLRFFSQPMEA